MTVTDEPKTLPWFCSCGFGSCASFSPPCQVSSCVRTILTTGARWIKTSMFVRWWFGLVALVLVSRCLMMPFPKTQFAPTYWGKTNQNISLKIPFPFPEKTCRWFWFATLSLSPIISLPHQRPLALEEEHDGRKDAPLTYSWLRYKGNTQGSIKGWWGKLVGMNANLFVAIICAFILTSQWCPYQSRHNSDRPWPSRILLHIHG